MKDNLQTYVRLFLTLFTVMRVMMFEKFSLFFGFFYVSFSLSVAYIFMAWHWVVSGIVVLLSILLFNRVKKGFEFLRRALIRKGDRVEYVDPKEKDPLKMFKRADILLKMRYSEMLKSKMLPEELIEGSSHFYLITSGKKPSAIAYDWITGISPEFLE